MKTITRAFSVISLATIVTMVVTLTPAFGKAPKMASATVVKKKAKKVQPVKKQEQMTSDKKFALLKQKYRLGDIDGKRMWSELTTIEADWSKLSLDNKVSLLQIQARILDDNGFPILAAIYSSQALQISKNYLDQDLIPSWRVLSQASQKQPIQSLLTSLAAQINLRGEKPPIFGNDWYYFVGSAAESRKDDDAALAAYGRVNMSDRHFLPAKYQRGMIFVSQNKLTDAEGALKAILYPASQEMSVLQENAVAEMVNYARIGLARIYYEKREFLESIKMYRSLDRTSPLFYDSLFEQSWAFFMGGYPNHALGAIHSVESPFFAEKFNPEALVLQAIIHYWMCRYDDSREALAKFMEKYAVGVESLAGFLERRRLSDETAYQLFEDVVAGVSSESLGIPRNILVSGAEKDSMLLVRDQYAAVLSESNRIKSQGIFGSKRSLDRPLDYLERWSESLRKELGSKYLTELRVMKNDYERLYSQAQFLYVELLMSEKEKLLGKDLHASTKMTSVSMRDDIRGWGKLTQSWATTDKNEYWWDEIGFYIYKVKPMCVATGSR